MRLQAEVTFLVPCVGRSQPAYHNGQGLLSTVLCTALDGKQRPAGRYLQLVHPLLVSGPRRTKPLLDAAAQTDGACEHNVFASIVQFVSVCLCMHRALGCETLAHLILFWHSLDVGLAGELFILS